MFLNFLKLKDLSAEELKRVSDNEIGNGANHAIDNIVNNIIKELQRCTYIVDDVAYSLKDDISESRLRELIVQGAQEITDLMDGGESRHHQHNSSFVPETDAEKELFKTLKEVSEKMQSESNYFTPGCNLRDDFFERPSSTNPNMTVAGGHFNGSVVMCEVPTKEINSALIEAREKCIEGNVSNFPLKDDEANNALKECLINGGKQKVNHDASRTSSSACLEVDSQVGSKYAGYRRWNGQVSIESCEKTSNTSWVSRICSFNISNPFKNTPENRLLLLLPKTTHQRLIIHIFQIITLLTLLYLLIYHH